MPSPVEILDELRGRLRNLEIPCALTSTTNGPRLFGGGSEAESPRQGTEGFEGHCFSVEVIRFMGSKGAAELLHASFGPDLRVSSDNPRRLAFAIFALVRNLPLPVPAA